MASKLLFSVATEFAVVNNNTAVATASALIVYSSGTGNLFYHQNGTATGLGAGSERYSAHDRRSTVRFFDFKVICFDFEGRRKISCIFLFLLTVPSLFKAGLTFTCLINPSQVFLGG
jgi:hypothetical protein